MQASLKPSNDCGSVELWKAFLDGRLDGDLIERMSDHLQGCSSCSATIESIDSQTKISLTTEVRPITEHLVEEQFGRLIDWLRDPNGLQLTDQPVPQSKLQPKDSIGRFNIRGELGSGGFGRVYLADDPLLNRQVAIKVPHENRCRNESEAIFIQEARNAAALELPGIVPIYDVVTEKSSLTLIVMKYVAGKSLASLQKTTSLERVRALGMIRQVAMAIHRAHELGFVHRDLKPANILIDEQDVAYVTDFGLGVFLSESQLNERSGGTPFYMSPEQVQRNEIDRRSDVWALGVMIAELFHGTRPFPQRKRTELFQAILADKPQLTTSAQNDAINRIIQRCLEKDPANRYPTALELAQDLEQWLHRSTLTGVQKWRYGWRRNLGILITCGLLTCGVLYGRTLTRNAELRSILNQLETAPGDQVPKLVRQVSLLKPAIGEIQSSIDWDVDCLWKQDLARIASSDANEANYNRLCDYFEIASPEHIAAICNTLADSDQALVLSNKLADRLQRNNPDNSSLLHLAAGLAQLNKDHLMWDSWSERLSQTILSTSSDSIGPWVSLLEPIGAKHLADKLFEHIQTSLTSKAQRQDGTKSLIRFLRDDSLRLTDLATRCDADALPIYLSYLIARREATEELKRRWVKLLENEVVDDYYDLAVPTLVEKQKARLAILLAAIGEMQEFEEAVQDSANPTLRTLAIHGLSELAVDPNQLLRIVQQRKEDHSESAATLKFSLLQVIALAPQNVDLSNWEQLIHDLWLSDPDPGVHSAVRLLASRIGGALAPLKPGRFGKWLVEPIGVTQQDFLIIPPGVAFVGRNDVPPPQPATTPWEFHSRNFTRTVAIAVNEVTVQQFKPLSQEIAEQLLMRGPSDAAMIKVSLNDAYRFCNWLSDSAGFEPCYELSSDVPNTFEPKPNHLDLNGYRLPTDAEWERACRAGTLTSRYIGNTPDLMQHYAWTADSLDQAVVENRLVVSQPVAKLLPNRWGLFDLYGNAMELCDPSLSPSNEVADDSTYATKPIEDQLAQVDIARWHFGPLIRGSSYIIRSEYARSHCRSNQLVGITTETKGLRLARTITEPFQ